MGGTPYGACRPEEGSSAVREVVFALYIPLFHIYIYISDTNSRIGGLREPPQDLEITRESCWLPEGFR